MTMLEALNDMHKSNPKHAEAAAYYGMAVLAYHHIFFGIKLYVSSAEEAEGEPLTDWKSLQGDQPWYDGEPKIVKKFTEFCEKRKNRPGFPEYEEFVQSLTACCEARDKLLHAITEESREELFSRRKNWGNRFVVPITTRN